MSMNEEKIISPCISVCKTDPVSGYCYGCGRSNDEKKIWKYENTLNEWKLANIKELENRLSGWQRNAFIDSYSSKKETGLSLIKKKLLETKNN